MPLPPEVSGQGVNAQEDLVFWRLRPASDLEEDLVLPIAEEHVGLAPLPCARVHVHLTYPPVTNSLQRYSVSMISTEI